MLILIHQLMLQIATLQWLTMLFFFLFSLGFPFLGTLVKREGQSIGASWPNTGIKFQKGRGYGDDQHSSSMHQLLSSS